MKILYVCNDLDYFKAHRWFLARAMAKMGWEVFLSTGGVQGSKTNTHDDDIKILDVNLDRHKLNLISDFRLIRSYLEHLKVEKPDVVHAITIKPILFMGIALLLNKMMRRSSPKLILTYPGLGKVFEPDAGFKAKVRKLLVSTILKLSNRILKPHATFENFASMEELAKDKIVTKARSSVVMGAGIDRDVFYSAKREGELIVLFASRLLNAKGLGEYIKAAKVLKIEFPNVAFQVAGKQELDNPDSFSMDALLAVNEAGIIDYIGSIDPDKMPEILRQADIHVAPSKLQEGLPRVVLEAATCGCCIIASDHEMLQRFVREKETGWLLKEISSEVIESALRSALTNPEKTRKMGKLISKNISTLPIFEDNLIAHFQKLYQT